MKNIYRFLHLFSSEANDTGYVEEDNIHVELDSVNGGGTNATRIGGRNSYSPPTSSGTRTDTPFDPNVHLHGSNQGVISHPYVWKAYVEDAKEDGLGRTAYVEISVQLLSGTTADAFKIKINDTNRHQVLLRDQDGDAKDIFFRGKAIAKALENYPRRARFYTTMLTEVTNNFTANITQESIISFPFELRRKIEAFVKLVPFISEETGDSSEISILFACFEIDWHDITEFSSGPIARSTDPVRVVRRTYEMPTTEQGYHNEVTPKGNHNKVTPRMSNRAGTADFEEKMEDLQRRLKELEPYELAPIDEDHDLQCFEEDNSTLLSYEEEESFPRTPGSLRSFSTKSSRINSSDSNTNITTVYSEKSRRKIEPSSRSRSTKSNGSKTAISCERKTGTNTTIVSSKSKSGDTIPDSIEYDDNDSANQSRSTKLSKDQSYSNSTDCERNVNYDSSSANYYSIVAAGSKSIESRRSKYSRRLCSSNKSPSKSSSMKSQSTKSSSNKSVKSSNSLLASTDSSRSEKFSSTKSSALKSKSDDPSNKTEISKNDHRGMTTRNRSKKP